MLLIVQVYINRTTVYYELQSCVDVYSVPLLEYPLEREKVQSRMYNLEKLAILGTDGKGRRQTKQHNTEN
jgi:hypothetical protein